VPNPAEDWISERAWNEILTLPALPTFARFAKDFRKHLEGFKRIFDSSDPHRYYNLYLNWIALLVLDFPDAQLGSSLIDPLLLQTS
jgi:hypothetical protein